MFKSKNFKIIKSGSIRNHRDQFYGKNFKKNLIKFYKNLKNGHKNLEQS